MVEEFNRGIYDYIIATDEVGLSRGGGVAGGEAKTASRKRKRDKEYGVTRGIDFQGKCEHVDRKPFTMLSLHIVNPLPYIFLCVCVH